MIRTGVTAPESRSPNSALVKSPNSREVTEPRTQDLQVETNPNSEVKMVGRSQGSAALRKETSKVEDPTREVHPPRGSRGIELQLP